MLTSSSSPDVPVIQTRVHGVRAESAGSTDAQHCADVQCDPEQQVAGRSQGDLRRRQDQERRPASQDERVHGVGRTGTRGPQTGRRFAILVVLYIISSFVRLFILYYAKYNVPEINGLIQNHKDMQSSTR